MSEANEKVPPSVEYLREEIRRFTDELARAEFELEKGRAQLSQAKLELAAAREESAKLKIEVTRLMTESDQEHAKYLAERKKSQRLEASLEDDSHSRRARGELIAERKRYQQSLGKLITQLEHLRTIHPVRALLAAKDNETEIAARALGQVPRNHPDRAAMERIVMMHQQEREQLREVAAHTEALFEQRRAEIAAAASDEPEAPDSQAGHPKPPPFAPRR